MFLILPRFIYHLLIYHNTTLSLPPEWLLLLYGTVLCNMQYSLGVKV